MTRSFLFEHHHILIFRLLLICFVLNWRGKKVQANVYLQIHQWSMPSFPYFSILSPSTIVNQPERESRSSLDLDNTGGNEFLQFARKFWVTKVLLSSTRILGHIFHHELH